MLTMREMIKMEKDVNNAVNNPDWKIILHELLGKYLNEEILPYKKNAETKQEYLCQKKYKEHEKAIEEIMELLRWDF